MTSALESNPLDRRLAFGVFALTLFVYAWFFGGTGWNQNSSFALTRAIVEEGTIRIDSYRSLTEDVAKAGSHWYSNKTPGTALLAVVPYWAIEHAERWAGIDPGAPQTFARNMFLCTVAVCGISGALIAAALFVYGVRAGAGRRYSLAVALLIAFGTPLFAYSTILFVHVPNAALLVGAFLAASSNRSLRTDALAGFLAGWAALTNYQCVPIVALLAVLTFRGQRRWKRTLACAAGAVLPLLALAVYQYSAFGALFTNPITENERFVTHSAWLGMIQAPNLEALWGITFSRYRGLFFLSPILLLAIPGFVTFLRTRRDARQIIFILLTLVLFFGFNVTFNGWRGGNGIGPRYLVPIIPLFGVLLLYARRVPHLIWWVAGVPSVLLNLAAVVVDPQPFEHISDPFGKHILPILFTGRGNLEQTRWIAMGRTSVNIDSFNLGEFLFGSGNLLSVVPVVVIAIAAVVLLFHAADRDRRLAAAYRAPPSPDHRGSAPGHGSPHTATKSASRNRSRRSVPSSSTTATTRRGANK